MLQQSFLVIIIIINFVIYIIVVVITTCKVCIVDAGFAPQHGAPNPTLDNIAGQVKLQKTQADTETDTDSNE